MLHDAVRVIDWPVNGALSLDDTVQLGGAVGCGCQLTVTFAADPVPDAFTPETEYCCAPALDAVVTQLEVEPAQPVHT